MSVNSVNNLQKIHIMFKRLMTEKDLKFKEKVLMKLILKAALKKKERLNSVLAR